MYVRSINVARFRQLTDVRIGPLPPPGQASELVVLAGPNGGGKTSVLELLSYALSSSWGYPWNSRRQVEGSAFEVSFGLSDGDIAHLEGVISETPGSDPDDVLSDLRTHRHFWRSFNLETGDAAATVNQDSRFYHFLQRVLADRIRGLFVKSDRNYPSHPYNKVLFFDSPRRRPGYLRELSFNLTDNQYADHMEHLVEQAYEYPRLLGRTVIERRRTRRAVAEPPNPLDDYNRIFQQLFPQYALSTTSDELTELAIALPSGQRVPFGLLSSGEQEVFFLLSFIHRHEISDSMIFIDEPELHLHSELARRMVNVLLGTRAANQVWLATHNADLIAEAGRDRVYYVTRETPASDATVRRATDETDEVALLRTIFGPTGYVGLARRVVFIEGKSGSLDRRVFTRLLPGLAADVQLVPIGSGRDTGQVHRAVLALLGTAFGYSEFYLIRDADYEALLDTPARGRGNDRIFRLGKHEIENYLLVPLAIATALADLGVETDPDEVERRLREVARALSGEVFKDAVAYALGRLFWSEDVSLGRFNAHKRWMDRGGGWIEATVTETMEGFVAKARTVRQEVDARAGDDGVREVCSRVRDKVADSLVSNDYLSVFPGKELLTRIAGGFGVGSGPQLQNAIIRYMSADPVRVDPELRAIFGRITET